eukprot:TRINITY_DN54896_c0_g1_i1.p1 TRINITY_DN54896_c0_g1~~TRINITY_DN54896_c0_g1_i1.p1  ORF type:complete len:295 (-),score=88.02 TRINITY_DN54896_c0_g1_i1:253-1086(-)
MPPKGVTMGPRAKGKVKGKGKAKSKAKARLARKAAALAVDPSMAADGAQPETILAVARPKAKASLRKKVLESLGEKNLEEALAEMKAAVRGKDALFEEHKALEEAQERLVIEAKTELESATAAVQEAIEEETAAGGRLRELKGRREDAVKAVSQKRLDLVEVQKKLAMIEVLALNHGRMKELESKRKAATAAAAEAKRALLEHRQKEKDALEATRAALAEARAAAKGVGKGGQTKRAAEELPEFAPAAKKPDVEESAETPDIDTKPTLPSLDETQQA